MKIAGPPVRQLLGISKTMVFQLFSYDFEFPPVPALPEFLVFPLYFFNSAYEAADGASALAHCLAVSGPYEYLQFYRMSRRKPSLFYKLRSDFADPLECDTFFQAFLIGCPVPKC